MSGRARVDAYFASRGWTAFAFQRAAWDGYLAGRSGLVHAPTGSGKTWSVFGGPAIEALAGTACGVQSTEERAAGSHRTLAAARNATAPLTLLWLTPMRALANDTAHNLARFCADLGLRWSVELRTSDTTSAMRKRQRDRQPSLLVTTPESLSVLLSYADAREKLSSVRCAVVDEWHELIATKRGTQTELGLARLRRWNPAMRTWALSATLGNLEEAARVLVPTRSVAQAFLPVFGEASAQSISSNDLPPDTGRNACATKESSDAPLLIHSDLVKRYAQTTLVPETLERFPWAGHIGVHQVDRVGDAILRGGSTLVFTNTRAQAEIWFRSLMQRRPDLIAQIAIHHGSLDRKLRGVVEGMLRDGKIKAVVCTSSLDLGVDFAAVDQVIQVGSPKGIARLMQRAGRSGHRPGEPSRLVCVPTHAFELIEFSAAREGIANKAVESRRPIVKPLDVLAQHVVTLASGGGFDSDDLLAEVRATHAFAGLSDEEWVWAMDFVTCGGPTLTAYDRFRKVVRDDATGLWHIASERLARLHRLSIGTIVGDGTVTLVTTGGKRLGTLEEGFVGKMKPGDVFVFAGQALELISLRQMVARVRPNKKKRASIVSWPGSKFPLSTMLSQKCRERLQQARDGIYVDAEMVAVKPVLDIQRRWSHLPGVNELLIERTTSREGVHYYLYPFLGRLVHEGLAAILGHRIGRETGLPVTATFTDYGIELLMPRTEIKRSKVDARTGLIHVGSPVHVDQMSDAMFARRAGESMDEPMWRTVLSPERLLDDLLACLNAGELTRRQFREISKIAGLLVPNTPGSPKSTRQLQASSELFYDVFVEFDPQNLLLEQAKREVLEQQLEVARLTSALEHLTSQRIVLVDTDRFTPMAFPLWAQRISSQTLRSEAATDRIERMLASLEASADAGATSV